MGRGFRIYFDVPELEEAIRQLSGYNGRKVVQLENVISNSTKQISKDARKKAPKRKGRLRKSIRSRFNKREVAGYVMAKASHAHFIELGAKGFTLNPKNKKKLKFQMQGETVFAKKANIPARAPKPFMKPAFDAEKPNLIKEIERVFANP